MFYEEYGENNKPIIVFLHGANFVQSFVRQYGFAENYRLIVPHITGYGKEAGTVYTTEKAVHDLSELIFSFGKKVTLVGFSLGAQLAFVLAAENPELFNGVVCISPWLIKEEPMLSKVVKQNEKAFGMMKKRRFVILSGKLNKLNKAQCEELVEQCKNVQLDTILNSVNNGIEIDDYAGFGEADIPILALAGKKEYDVVTRSIIKMSELNPRCTYEIWNKAAHNIPTVFADKFNERLNTFLKEIN